MTKVTAEQKEEAVRIAIDGGDPRKFLQKCGSQNHELMWGHIRAQLKENDPETFRKLPRRIPRIGSEPKKQTKAPKSSLADAMTGMQDAADKFFGKCEEMGLTKAVEPLRYDSMIVREVEGEFGRYRRVDTNGETYIDFQSKEGTDLISRTVEEWRSFQKEHTRAATILGVEL